MERRILPGSDHRWQGVQIGTPRKASASVPELFLLAGVSIASIRAGDARIIRARAEFQAALAESSVLGRGP